MDRHLKKKRKEESGLIFEDKDHFGHTDSKWRPASLVNQTFQGGKGCGQHST